MQLRRLLSRAMDLRAWNDGFCNCRCIFTKQRSFVPDQSAARAAAAREYAAKKGVPAEEEEESTTALSGLADRPYCKGRAYDPNRYNTESTEE